MGTMDCDQNHILTKPELQEYIKPLVKAMCPSEAEVLQPVLIRKVADEIYDEMNLDHVDDISSQEMLEWMHRGNNIIDRISDIIEGELHQICKEISKNEKSSRRRKGGADSSS